MNKKKTNQNQELKQSEKHLPHQHKDVKVLSPAPKHLLSKTSTPSQEKLGRVDNHRLLTQSGSKQKQLWNNKEQTAVSGTGETAHFWKLLVETKYPLDIIYVKMFI